MSLSFRFRRRIPTREIEMSIEHDSTVAIRLAVPEDSSAIASVLNEAFREYRSQYTQSGFKVTVPPAEEILNRMQEGPLWIALYGVNVVGTISAVVKQEGLYIRGMAIVPDARGKRIGVTLLQQAESFGLERGIRRLFLSTTPFLFRAISLYENYGFTKSPSGPHDLCGTPLFTMEKLVECLTRNRAAPAEQIHNGT